MCLCACMYVFASRSLSLCERLSGTVVVYLIFFLVCKPACQPWANGYLYPFRILLSVKTIQACPSLNVWRCLQVRRYRGRTESQAEKYRGEESEAQNIIGQNAVQGIQRGCSRQLVLRQGCPDEGLNPRRCQVVRSLSHITD